MEDSLIHKIPPKWMAACKNIYAGNIQATPQSHKRWQRKQNIALPKLLYPQRIARANMLLFSHCAIAGIQHAPFETSFKTSTTSLEIHEDGGILVTVHHGERVHAFNSHATTQINLGDHIPNGGGVWYLKMEWKLHTSHSGAQNSQGIS